MSIRTLLSANSHDADWQIVDLSLHVFNLVNVALYDTLGRDSVGTYTCRIHLSPVYSNQLLCSQNMCKCFLFAIVLLRLTIESCSINHAETSIIFASAANVTALLQLAPRTPCVKIVVSMEELNPTVKSVLVAWGKSRNIRVMELPELEEFGRANMSDPLPASGTAIATICYTSVRTSVSLSREFVDKRIA